MRSRYRRDFLLPGPQRLPWRVHRWYSKCMRMTNGDSGSISRIVGSGDRRQVEQEPYHIPHLSFCGSSIPCNRQLDLIWRVLRNGNAALNQRQQRHSASLSDRNSCWGVLAKEKLLNGCLLWAIVGDHLSKLFIKLLQTLRVNQPLRCNDRVAGNQVQGAPMRCHDGITRSTIPRVNAQDEAFFIHSSLFSSSACYLASPAEALFAHTQPGPLRDDQMVEYFHLQEFPSLYDGLCGLNVFGAGIGGSGRVVVRDDNRGAIEQQGQPEQFTYSHDRRVQTSPVQRLDTLHVVAGIQAHLPKFLVIEVPHLQHQQGCNISRSRNAFIC